MASSGWPITLLCSRLSMMYATAEERSTIIRQYELMVSKLPGREIVRH